MQIIEFKDEKYIIDYFKNCKWGAAKLLYNLIMDNKVKEVLGGLTKIICLVDKIEPHTH